MSYSLLEKLLPYLKEYESHKAGEDHDLEEFVDWLRLNRQDQSESSEAEDQMVNAEIARYIGELFKHAKGYIKKAFEGTVFSSPDDFAYLAVLSRMGSLRKTTLIQENVGEVSAGMEVIKRLKRHGLIRDYPDPSDRRSRRVEITPEGQQAFQEVLQPMWIAGDIIAGGLPLAERKALLSTLKKLAKVHKNIYQDASHNKLGEIRSMLAS